MSCLGNRNDTIIYDELCHASIRDGIRLSVSRSFSFAHNDAEDLRKKIKNATGQVFVVTESIFSMDGDAAPLKELSGICTEQGAYFIVDEAHAIGIFGKNGSGLVDELKLNEDVFIRIVTFGKGAGSHGAAALCSDEVKNYLVNFCRPFIYSTALPPADCIAIMTVHEVMMEKEDDRSILKKYITYFRDKINQSGLELIPGIGPVCAVIVPGNEKVKQVSQVLIENKIGVLPVLTPTVPEGKERLRIILHSFNTIEQIDELIQLLLTHGT